MTNRSVKIPGPDHPIEIVPTAGRVIVTVPGAAVAESRRALTLRESSYPPVQYLPRSDVAMALLQRTQHRTYCPYKGDCSYFSVVSGDAVSINAAWSYESPHAAVALIRDCIAFYPDRVQLTVISDSP